MSKFTFEPYHDYVAVEQELAKEKTEGGVIIPDVAKEKPPIGKILAIGPDCKTAKVGHKVYMLRNSGMDIDNFMLISEKSILGKL